jgi:predicted  nucleic acid-binding Zn-ribbon protein
VASGEAAFLTDVSTVAADRKKLEEELNALDEQRSRLDAAIRDAQNRQRYGREPDAVAKARADEASLVKDLDHLMTRYRALEAQLLLVQSGQKTPW